VTKINYTLKVRRGTYLLVWTIILSFAVFTLINSKISKEAALTGLYLCYKYVIPSVFPFLVLSSLIIETGLGEFLGIAFGAPVSKLFNLSKSSVFCYFLGIISGFPIGAKNAAELYNKGIIEKEEAERLIAICNPCSPPFILGAVGATLLGNVKIGFLILLFQTLFYFLYGIVLGVLAKKPRGQNEYKRPSILKTYSLNYKVFTDSVKSSVTAMLSICGFVIFFSLVVKVASVLILFFTDNPLVCSLIAVFFEMTSGIYHASELDKVTAVWVSTAVVVFSGMSVHMQVASFTTGAKLNLTKYFVGKVIAFPVVAGAVTFVCKLLNYA